ncbi:MAG: gliding motility-associated C-terminal domain-containing protein [Crocinitomicaceae bacterium]|nr:gliding motility-associated C-terminal domain-containing protein [Crocinitomicaceae bacterium]
MKHCILLYLLLIIGLQTAHSQEIPEINSQFQFIENKGQWPEQVNFRAEVPGGFIWLEKDKFNYQFRQIPHIHGLPLEEANKVKAVIKQHVIFAQFLGCNETKEAIKNNKSLDYYNYFLGNDKQKWASYCYAYSDITYKNFYDGIDLRVYEKQKDLKYDFTLQPGAKNSIQIKYSGQNRIQITKHGNLVIETSLGQIIEEKPYAYQIQNGKLIEVECSFELKKDVVSFKVGDYNPKYKLIIDPVLVFASYSGSLSDNFGMTATYDEYGNMFSGGTVFGNSYPTTAGAYDENGNFTNVNAEANDNPAYGTTDVFITKYSSNGTSRIYSTYIGGGGDNGGSETVNSLICDSLGNLHLFGATSSATFPVQSNAYQSNFNGGQPQYFYFNGVYFSYDSGLGGGCDIYVAKLDSTGGNLLGCTYVGGTGNDGISYNSSSGNYNTLQSYDSLTTNYGDQCRGEIMLDDSGYVYISSSTYSDDFPIVNGFQSVIGGQQDAVICKLSPGLDSLIWSSYLGGSDKDGGYSVKVNSSNEVIICGGTCSNDLPTNSNSYIQNFQGGKTDGYIALISSDGSTLQNITYLGTSSYDQSFFVELDRWDNIYTISQSLGSFPISPGTYSNPNSSQLLTKFDPTLDNLLVSTVFGNGNGQINISPSAFLVDFCGNVYVSGWGANILQSTSLSGMPVTANAFQPAPPNGFDFYLIVLERDFEGLIYGTYLGGNWAQEHVDGGTSRFDKNGIVYQSVCGGCRRCSNDSDPLCDPNSDFPTTPGAVSNFNLSGNCNNLVFKFDFEIVPRAEFSPDITVGCAPFTVQFMNTSSDSTNYLWDFGDGDTTSQVFNPTKVYDTPGVYQVKLLVTDTICLLVDTAEVTITVYDSLLLETMNDTVICGPSTFDIWASSYGTTVEFQWSSSNQFLDTLNTDLADSVLTINPGNPQYYYVRITNPWCTEIDSVYIDFIGDVLLVSPDTNICGGDVITLGAININPSVSFTYTWGPSSEIISGQGTEIITVSPDSSTTFTLTATSSNGCVINETIDVGVYYLDPSTVDATADYDTVFQGGSTFLHAFPDTTGIQYIWYPANGLNDPTSQSPVATPEQTTMYTVIIIKGGCTDTAQVKVTVLENICDDPSVFIPNAFTPNSDGNNDIVYVRGDNIELMTFRIFDRWGEMVFETQDQNIGWDGKFKGKLLNPDVYVYYLDVTCVGGDEQLIKGNITIIR